MGGGRNRVAFQLFITTSLFKVRLGEPTGLGTDRVGENTGTILCCYMKVSPFTAKGEFDSTKKTSES